MHGDECGCCQCLAPIIDGTPWPELTGDEDASAFVDRVQLETNNQPAAEAAREE